MGFCDFMFTTNEGGKLRGKIMIDCFQGCERWKIGKKIGGNDLIQMFRPDDILQTAFPHITQFCSVRKPVLDQIVRGLRKQDLPAVSNRHDPLGQGQGPISFIRCALCIILQQCGARMNAHPHFDGRGRPGFLL